MSNSRRKRVREDGSSDLTAYPDLRRPKYMTRGHKILLAIQDPKARRETRTTLKRPCEAANLGPRSIKVQLLHEGVCNSKSIVTKDLEKEEKEIDDKGAENREGVDINEEHEGKEERKGDYKKTHSGKDNKNDNNEDKEEEMKIYNGEEDREDSGKEELGNEEQNKGKEEKENKDGEVKEKDNIDDNLEENQKEEKRHYEENKKAGQEENEDNKNKEDKTKHNENEDKEDEKEDDNPEEDKEKDNEVHIEKDIELDDTKNEDKCKEDDEEGTKVDNCENEDNLHKGKDKVERITREKEEENYKDMGGNEDKEEVKEEQTTKADKEDSDYQENLADRGDNKKKEVNEGYKDIGNEGIEKEIESEEEQKGEDEEKEDMDDNDGEDKEGNEEEHIVNESWNSQNITGLTPAGTSQRQRRNDRKNDNKEGEKEEGNEGVDKQIRSEEEANVEDNEKEGIENKDKEDNEEEHIENEYLNSENITELTQARTPKRQRRNDRKNDNKEGDKEEGNEVVHKQIGSGEEANVEDNEKEGIENKDNEDNEEEHIENEYLTSENITELTQARTPKRQRRNDRKKHKKGDKEEGNEVVDKQIGSEEEANVEDNEKEGIENKNNEDNEEEHIENEYLTSENITELTQARTPKRQRRNDRKNYCIFCFTLCSNFRRHLLRKHKYEMEVSEYLALLEMGGSTETEESKEKRNKIFEKIRYRGNMEYNKILLKDMELSEIQDIELLPVRRPPTYRSPKVENYITCKLCSGMFSKTSFRKHVPKCKQYLATDDPDTDLEDDENSIFNSNRPRKCPNFSKKFGNFNTFMAESVSEQVKKNIIPLLKLDDASKTALKDPLLMGIISDFHSNHLQIKDKYVVTKKIHDGGKLLLKIKEKDNNIKNFRDCFDPMVSNIVLQAVKDLCGTDSESGNVRVVGMPARLSWLLNEGANRALVDTLCDNSLTIEEKELIKRRIAEFTQVKKIRWKYIVSTNAELTRKRRKIESIKIMPLDEDIKTFSSFLRVKEKSLCTQLKKEQSCSIYEELCEVTIAHIITLNRRRPAEAANAELKNYLKRQNKETFSSVILETLDNDQREAMGKLEMFVVPGKNEHEVPVLLTDQMVENINLMIKLRPRLSIPPKNKFLFARPGLETPFSGSKVMKKMVDQCAGLKNPSHLTPTGLRHHVASVSQVHGETFVNHLAKFMGHSTNIHKHSYQLPSEILQRAVVGKELLMMEGGLESSPTASHLQMPQNEKLHPQEEDLNEDSSENETIQQEKSRGRNKWTEEEKMVVLTEFKSYVEMGKNPGLPKCRELIQRFKVLERRTAAQINAMVNNINKGKLKLI